jgi:hypothetical protein
VNCPDTCKAMADSARGELDRKTAAYRSGSKERAQLIERIRNEKLALVQRIGPLSGNLYYVQCSVPLSLSRLPHFLILKNNSIGGKVKFSRLPEKLKSWKPERRNWSPRAVPLFASRYSSLSI